MKSSKLQQLLKEMSDKDFYIYVQLPDYTGEELFRVNCVSRDTDQDGDDCLVLSCIEP